jgi:hypothetical protein
MPVSYDYAFMFQTLDISKIGNIATESGAVAFGKQMVQTSRNLSESLKKLDDGGWEIVSHDINFSGLIAILTFLIRHQVGPDTGAK